MQVVLVTIRYLILPHSQNENAGLIFSRYIAIVFSKFYKGLIKRWFLTNCSFHNNYKIFTGYVALVYRFTGGILPLIVRNMKSIVNEMILTLCFCIRFVSSHIDDKERVREPSSKSLVKCKDQTKVMMKPSESSSQHEVFVLALVDSLSQC